MRALSNGSGSLTDSYDYDAFGVAQAASGSSVNPYRYSGEWYDSTLGQYYLRARYYAPQVGRFSQMDSWHGARLKPVTLHKYLYGNADPISNSDPSGHFSLAQFSVGLSIATLSASSTLSYTSALNALVVDANSFEKRNPNDSLRLLLVNEFKASIPISYQLGELKAFGDYIDLVKTNGAWDYKNRPGYRKIPGVEAFGNFAFGATAVAWADGASGGISPSLPDLTINLAQRGAGWYQENNQLEQYRVDYGHWYDMFNSRSSYGDDPKDMANIIFGAEYYFSKRDSFLELVR